MFPCDQAVFSSSHITLQLTGPAPSWHPGGSDSPASLWEKGGDGEGWEGRKEEGMNQNTIKGTEWPFWELKACWLEPASHRQWREGERLGERVSERSRERDDDEVKGQWDLLFHDKERLQHSLCRQQNRMSFKSVTWIKIQWNSMKG